MGRVTVDALGGVYIGLAIAWSAILAGGMFFLFRNRRSPTLQIRRLPLVFAAVIVLQLYLILCLLDYTLAPVGPCQAEYFIMSLYVPMGIALFQAANTQFLYVATQQSIFTHFDNLDDASFVQRRRSRDQERSIGFRNWLRGLRCLDKIKRMAIYIAIGMFLQVLLTLFIFLISKKFHPGFGLVSMQPSKTDAEQKAQCVRGWEWWPSIFWQFFWAWLYAPWILFKSRNINDTHGWRTQTILCCISGLPASPMWLAGLYAPAMAPVNSVFLPPMWFALSIFFLQLFSIFIPCWHVFRHQALRQETLDTIAAWEDRNRQIANMGSDFSTDASTLTENSLASTRKLSCASSKDILMNMTALEKALRWESERLQEFAALKDFTGENISFLHHVTKWKQSWSQLQNESPALPSERDDTRAKQYRQQFNKAIRIYAAFVSLRYAEFPINLAAKNFSKLEVMFDRPSTLLYGSTDGLTSNERDVSPFASIEEKGRNAVVSTSEVEQRDLVWYWGSIPAEFDESVFNDAEKEIKYLVLTNTWPKFVNQGYWAEEDQDPGLVEKIIGTFRHGK